MPRTIVLLHGMWSNASCWDGYLRRLEARGFRCIAPTLRHHHVDPQSAPDPRLGTVGLLDYAGDLAEDLAKLGEKPIVIGHSMGGLLAQILAGRGLVTALVLLTPASPRGIQALTPSVVRSFFDILTRWGFWRRPHRLSFERAVYAMLNRLSPEDQRKVYARFVFEAGRAAAEIGFWFLDRHRASAVNSAGVTCPVLVFGAAHDHLTPASVVRKVAALYSRTGTYRELPDHAHWVLAEPGWEQIVDSIADWLDRLPPSTSGP